MSKDPKWRQRYDEMKADPVRYAEYLERARAGAKKYYEKNKEKVRARQLKWQRANPINKSEYYKKNKERILANHRAYYQANKERIKAKAAAWFQANKERRNQQQKEYRAAHPEKVKQWKANHKKKKELELMCEYDNENS